MIPSPQQDITTLLKDLIRFRSTNMRKDELHACVAFIERYFADSGLETRMYFDHEIPSLVVTKHTKTPKVFLYGHFDVVDGDDAQFEAREKDGRIYGRGAMDMKSGVAIFMYLMKELAKTEHDVGLILVGDEEVGGRNGAVRLVEEGYHAPVLLMPDGGNVIDHIIVKEKGMIRFTLDATGVSAHGSRPWMGVSAIDRVIDACEKVKALFVSLDAHPEDRWVDTFNVGMLHGGTAFNAVPDTASAFCDVRTIETTDQEELIERIKSVLPEGVTMNLVMSFLSTAVPTDHPLMTPYVEEVKALGREPQFQITHGSSDARHFAVKDMISIMSQPDGGNYHGKDEWVSIDAMMAYYELVKKYLDRVAR